MKILITALLLLTACTTQQVKTPEVEKPPVAEEKAPEAPAEVVTEVRIFADWPKIEWSEMTLKAIYELGGGMANATVKDADKYCPKFNSLKEEQKVAVLVTLISAMARYESGFKPENSYKENFKDAKGNYVISRGLLQISQESANSYGCGITKAEMLHDPETNLRCAVRILNRWIPKDGYIGSTVSGKNLGGARYWSVLRNSSGSQAKIQAKVKALEACR